MACVWAVWARVSRSETETFGPVATPLGYVPSALTPKPMPTPTAPSATPPITSTIGDGARDTGAADALAEGFGAEADADAVAEADADGAAEEVGAARCWMSTLRLFFAPRSRLTMASTRS